MIKKIMALAKGSMTKNGYKNNMTEKGYQILDEILADVPPIWDKPASSSGRFHHGESVGEHTYAMLDAGLKIMSMYGYAKDTTGADVICMAVVLHDCRKYGEHGTSKHTVSHHDYLAGELVRVYFGELSEHLGVKMALELFHALTFHSGRWSYELEGDKDTSVLDHRLTHLLHTVDMLESRGCLKNECLDNGGGLRKVAYYLLAEMKEVDEDVREEVNEVCPNLTCCPSCGVDDFVHSEDCDFYI